MPVPAWKTGYPEKAYQNVSKGRDNPNDSLLLKFLNNKLIGPTKCPGHQRYRILENEKIN
jgi:hypothetical protein